MERNKYHVILPLRAIGLDPRQYPGMKRMQQTAISEKKGDQFARGFPMYIHLQLFGCLPDSLRDLWADPAGPVHHPPNSSEADPGGTRYLLQANSIFCHWTEIQVSTSESYPRPARGRSGNFQPEISASPQSVPNSLGKDLMRRQENFFLISRKLPILTIR